ncbi:hypothetical protein AOLI_G00062530 [Acnodon oligacanthus]
MSEECLACRKTSNACTLGACPMGKPSNPPNTPPVPRALSLGDAFFLPSPGAFPHRLQRCCPGRAIHALQNSSSWQRLQARDASELFWVIGWPNLSESGDNADKTMSNIPFFYYWE